MAYSMWPATAVEEYALLHGGDTFTRGRLDRLAARTPRGRSGAAPCGLFRSNDDRTHEFSISGPASPTLNSYMCGDAAAISRMARVRPGRAGRGFAVSRRSAPDGSALWTGIFTKPFPAPAGTRPILPADPPSRRSATYGSWSHLPWAFGARTAEGGRCGADERGGFAAPRGLTTAECITPLHVRARARILWNGPLADCHVADGWVSGGATARRTRTR